jgi:hypothetical protein
MILEMHLAQPISSMGIIIVDLQSELKVLLSTLFAIRKICTSGVGVTTYQ